MRIRLFLFLLYGVARTVSLHAIDLSHYRLADPISPPAFLDAYPFPAPPAFTTLTLAHDSDTKEGVNEVLPVYGKTEDATFSLIFKKFNGNNSPNEKTRSTLFFHAQEMAYQEYACMNALFQQSSRHFIEPLGIYSIENNWALLMRKGPTTLYSRLFPIKGDISKMRPFSLSRALQVAEGLAEGLQYMQQLGLIHGDIKPANILLPEDPDSPPLFIDFGYMFHAEQEPHKATFFCGSPYYLAPEIHLMQNSKKSKRGVEIDYFSIGCILHELLHGERYTISLMLQNPYYRQYGTGTINLPLLTTYILRPDHFQRDHQKKAATSLSDYDRLISDLTHFDPTQRLHDANVLLSRIQDMRQALQPLESEEEKTDMTKSSYIPELEENVFRFSYEEITIEEAKQATESFYANQSWGAWLVKSIARW